MYVGEVVGRGGEPADLHVDVGRRRRDGMTSSRRRVDEVGGRLVLRVGGGEHLDAPRRRPRRSACGGVANATPGVSFELVAELVRARRCRPRRSGVSAASSSGPLKPGAEALGQEVVGLARGVGSSGRLPASVKPRRIDSSGSASTSRTSEPDDRGGPRAALDRRGSSGTSTDCLIVAFGALAVREPELVDVAADEAEQRGQQRDRREHRDEHADRRCRWRGRA